LQIELIGCTSAGKSTLTRSILQACHQQGLDILLGDDFVLRQVRLNWIKSHLLRKLLVNLVALSASLVTWRTNLKIYRFAAQFLFQLPITQLEKLNTLKNVLKRVGIYEIIRVRSTDRQAILIDEGVLQAAHYLFVHSSVQVKAEHLATFARLAPLPDVVVYLRQPESLLIDRTMRRGHKRIPNRSYSNVVPFIERAVATFDKLAQHPAVERKLLVVDGGQAATMAANNQDDPIMGLALEIIRSGFTSDTTEMPTETTLSPGRHTVPTSLNSLLGKRS
jgi:thymidylate kinase